MYATVRFIDSAVNAATFALCQPHLTETFRLWVSSKEHLSVRYPTNMSLGI